MNTSVSTQNTPIDQPEQQLSLHDRLAVAKHVLKIDAMLFVGIMFLALLALPLS